MLLEAGWKGRRRQGPDMRTMALKMMIMMMILMIMVAVGVEETIAMILFPSHHLSRFWQTEWSK